MFTPQPDKECPASYLGFRYFSFYCSLGNNTSGLLVLRASTDMFLFDRT